MANVAMLGTGLIGLFYTMSLHGKRSRDRVVVVQGRDPEKTRAFAEKWGIPRWTTSLEEAVSAADVDLVVIGLPNHLHLEAVRPRPARARASSARSPSPAPRPRRRQMLDAVEKAGVFHGYLEDLVYTPKTLKALAVGPQGRDRPRAVDPLARGAPRAAQRLVLDEGDLGRRRHRGHGLPHASRSAAASWARTCGRSRSSAGARRRCTRSRPRTRRSASSATRAAPSRSSRWPGRSAAAWTCATRSRAPRARSGSTTGCARASRCSRRRGPAATSPRRRRRSRAGSSRWATRCRPSATTTCSPTCSTPSSRSARRWRPSTTATSSTRSWTPATARWRRSGGSRSLLDDWRGAAEAESAGVHVEYDARHWLIKLERMPDGRRKLILKDKQTGAVSQRVE